MAARNLLHKNDLFAFAVYAASIEGLTVEAPTLAQERNWQLIRIRYNNHTHVIYERADMKEHVTVPKGLIWLARQFINWKRIGLKRWQASPRENVVDSCEPKLGI